MKTCSKCKCEISLKLFSKDKSKKDKLDSWCKNCRNTYKKENVAKFRDSKNTWKKNNKHKVLANVVERRIKTKNRMPLWLSKEQIAEIHLFYKMAKELETIFPWKQHVDHIVPLLGKTVSGLHVPWNLQILSAKYNMEKGNRYNG